MTIEQINPLAIKAQAAKTQAGGFKSTGFGTSMLDAANAMSGTAATAGALYGTNTAASAITAAFSGLGTMASVQGQNMSMGASVGYGGGGGFAAQSIGAGGLNNTSAIPGTDGMSQMDMINTMNQNNLGLLELQAVMQNNMQGWNTKSNILSADHRARMAMIEKFTAR